MKQLAYILTIISIVLFVSCNNTSVKQETKDETPTDTTKSIKVGTVWVTPKPIYDFPVLKLNKDTIDLVTVQSMFILHLGLSKTNQNSN